MTRVSIQDIISIGDPAFAHNFSLYLPYIPGSTDTRDLTYKCQSTDLPGFGVEVGEVLLHGVKVPYAGAETFTQTMNVTFVETLDWSTRAKLRTWSRMTRSWQDNKGSLAANYKIDPQIVLWDDTPQVVRTIQIYGFFLETYSEVQLDGSNGSTVIQSNATFRYTYHIDI